MKTVSRTRLVAVVITAIAVALGAGGVAIAGFGKKVQKTFRGQILITADKLDLSAGDSDADSIKHCNQARLKVVESADEDGVATWRFFYTAFFTKHPTDGTVSLDFYTDDKDKLYVANKKMTGVDPKIATLQAHVVITEDDGLNPGRKYIVKLTGTAHGKEVVLATTKLATK